MRRSGYNKEDAPVAVMFTQAVGVALAVGCFPMVLIGLFTFNEEDHRILLTGYAMAAASWLIRLVLPYQRQK